MSARCQSCSMTIENGTLCEHCSDDAGRLISFEECLDRFMQWTSRREPGLSREEAERKTVAFMATMPAWANHPELRARRGGEPSTP